MKKIVVLTIACLLTFGNLTYAHTGIESSNPEDGSTITEELNKVTLTFETEIEETSSFELQNASGQTVAVDNITVENNTMTGTFDQPIENGDYEATWKIIGVDGHPIEGTFSFSVDAPESELAEEESTSEEATDDSEEKDTQVQADKEETKADTAEEESSNGAVIGIVIAVLVIVLIGSVLLMRRKK
ncbi:copper resistance protein CopC [Bacillus sp. RAR_GA_16]|uniref:copper resistance protein CopC n=1 Tax=Bacillus sp. RAR_GA_16 TaxID=2876774 RepID=UPI001CCEDA6B|nr:copper resistance protein CopC [Bacillus sp. RAR_GA_16]MCA0173838.1 copper resistance protein CopC [Bacillus sp. RAR_GA_16]